jgi:hypothetical protein
MNVNKMALFQKLSTLIVTLFSNERSTLNDPRVKFYSEINLNPS